MEVPLLFLTSRSLVVVYNRVEVVGRDLMVYRGSSPGFATVMFDYTDSLGVKRSHSWSFMVI